MPPMKEPCRGGYCDNFERCTAAGTCTYKSSAQEARDRMNVEGRLDEMEKNITTLFRLIEGIQSHLNEEKDRLDKLAGL